MQRLSDDFVRKIAKSLSEEEIDLYILTLHYKNQEDMKYFNAEDQKRIRAIFDVLIKDTKRHAKTLELIVELASK